MLLPSNLISKLFYFNLQIIQNSFFYDLLNRFRRHTDLKSNISLLTSTLIRQDGQLSLHSAPCFVNKPSRHFLQYEWRHGKTLGSLYSSKQTAHSNSFAKFWARDEAFAIVKTFLLWTEIGMEVSFVVGGKRMDCLWKCKETRVELLVFSNTTQ